MKLKILLYLFFLLCFVEIIMVYFDVKHSVYIRPICVFLIYKFYVVNTKKHNFFLLFYLLCELINEIFFLIDFRAYFEVVMISYILATFTMIYHLWSVFKCAEIKVKRGDLFRPVLGLLAVLYIFWELTLILINDLPNNFVFFLALAALLCWIFFCSLTPVKNKHPDNFILYIMGGSMGVMAPTMFIYTFLWQSKPILILCLFSMLLLKLSLVWYMIKVDEILASENAYF